MEPFFATLPRIPVTLHCDTVVGAFEGWRHTIGHGGINHYPLPPRVSRGLADLKPRLVRTFIQEYFHIYPAHDTYDWSLLDPYMESLAQSGGKIVASICIKPKPLYPVLDQRIVMPNNIDEWQHVIETLVRRYSVEKPYVTYWEVSNESDIGETGGCPLYTPEPDDYNAFYAITQAAVRRAFPEAKVGGPALANVESPLMEGLIQYCVVNGIPLDFVSWHRYSDYPDEHAQHVWSVRQLLRRYYPANLPEMLITEMSKGFDDAPPEECAYGGYRPAAVGAAICDMMDAGDSWSFYYHIWDQVFVTDQFRDFFSDPDIMLIHWNKIPHRFGLFGVCGEVRPLYFFYRMLSSMVGNAIKTTSAAPDIRVKAADDSGTIRVLLVNYDMRSARDTVVTLDFNGIRAGLRRLTVYKLDGERRWDEETLRLTPTEQRFVDIAPDVSDRAFYMPVYCPAYSVVFITLETVTEAKMAAAFRSIS